MSATKKDVPRPGGAQAKDSGLRLLMGELEAEIMELAWAAPGPLAVRDVYEALRLKRAIAYTTVMTVMGRLAKKGLLTVDKSEMTHRYTPALSREAYTAQAVGGIIDRLVGAFPEAAAAHFAQTPLPPAQRTAWLRRIQDARAGEA